MENADTIGARLVLLLGPKDIDKGVISVRKVSSGEQLEIGMDDQIVSALKKLLEWGSCHFDLVQVHQFIQQ